eukprot:2176472-Pleurochrysis_carterae.AAC.5
MRRRRMVQSRAGWARSLANSAAVRFGSLLHSCMFCAQISLRMRLVASAARRGHRTDVEQLHLALRRVHALHLGDDGR